MPTVFLSRNIKASSPFAQLAQQTGWQVRAESLLRFRPVAVPELPAADWYFFYSRRGVEFLLQQHALPANAQTACLGPSAALALRKAGYTPNWIGDGQAHKAVQFLLQTVSTGKLRFVQARHSVASVQTQLRNASVQHDNLVVYDNDIRTDFLPITADYLLFTSPLNIRAYVNQQGIPTQARIISIGHTTGTTLTQLGLTQFRIAQQPNEDALLDCLLDWETNTSILRTQKDDPETY